MSENILSEHLIALLVILLAYFLPLFVAALRKAKARDGIAVVNLFLGWTFVGWVVALAWAVSGEVEQPSRAPAVIETGL